MVILLFPGLKLLEIELFPGHAVVDKTANKTHKNGFALELGPAPKMPDPDLEIRGAVIQTLR